MQGAQKLRSEAHLQVRLNDEVAAQRSRWTFYEAILSGNNSVVECNLAKVEVAGSNPVSRSIFFAAA